MATSPSCCPVCKAPFRARRRCPRCQADLAALMALEHEAHLTRNAARARLRAGSTHEALRLARAAQTLHATRAGERLLLLAHLIAAPTVDESLP